MIRHPVKFQEPDHSEDADQQPKQDLIEGKRDQQRDCPKRDRLMNRRMNAERIPRLRDLSQFAQESPACICIIPKERARPMRGARAFCPRYSAFAE